MSQSVDHSRESPALAARCLVWLAWAIGLALLTSLLTALWFVLSGESVGEAISATAIGQLGSMLEVGGDSLAPMLAAHAAFLDDEAVYAIVFEDGIKFQYPPSSLLILDVLPTTVVASAHDELPGSLLLRAMALASLVSVMLTIVLSAAIIRRSIQTRSTNAPSARLQLGVLALAGVAGLLYYPVLKGHSLGQLQVFLNCAIALAIYASISGFRGAAGVLLGLCCLFKPHYGLIAIWALLRRDWRFVAIFGATAATGFLIALLRYGIDNHLDYLRVLSTMSRHGEVFWANQSFNGFFHRLFETADPAQWTANEFAPYHRGVYVLTLSSSLIITAFALWSRRVFQSQDGWVIDLSTMIAAITVASPVAWEHHYGAFFPLIALSLPALIDVRPLGRYSAAIALLGWILMAAVVDRPEIFFGSSAWVGMMASHLLFGALCWLTILLALRTQTATGSSSGGIDDTSRHPQRIGSFRMSRA